MPSFSSGETLLPLVRKLDSVIALTHDDKARLLALPATVKDVASRSDIVREGDRPTHCCLVLDGMLCRYTILSDGKRQIQSLHIAGDLPDLHSLHLVPMDHSIASIGPARIALVPHGDIRQAVNASQVITEALWREALVDAAIFRTWTTRIGRRHARGRITHLLCELATRARAVALENDEDILFPLTQGDLADASGLTNVHVNRIVQDLRSENLIAADRSLKILDWKAIEREAEFDPAYLHLRKAADLP